MQVITNFSYILKLKLCAEEMGEALDRAIEKTKLHQSADRDTHDTKMARTTQTKNSLPLRMEGLDVEKQVLFTRKCAEMTYLFKT